MSIKQISLTDHMVQSKGSIVSDMGREKVMLSINNGKYYNLGEIGGRIWDLLQNPISGQQVVETLMTEYTVNQNECEEHVISFMEQLSGEGLIQLV